MSKEKHAVVYLDGIRGIAAFGVFLNHFLLAFYSAANLKSSHVNGLEIKYRQSVLSFLDNGGFCVAIFFVLSGFVLSRKYFLTNNIEVPISGLHRRFIRLYVPIAFTLIISYLLMISHLYFNEEVSKITISDWFERLWRFSQPTKRILSSLSFGTMFCGDASFDTCLWTISYELYGSFFVYAFLVFTHYTSKYRLFMMFVAIYYFYLMKSPFYLAFVLGMSLCYTERWFKSRRSVFYSIIAFLLLIVGLTLGSVPFCYTIPRSWQEHIKNTVWDYTTWCATAAAYLLVLSYIMSPFLQKTISLRPFRFLGYLSFSLYLLHPLLLGSFSSWLFLKLLYRYSYNQSALVVFLSTIALLLPLSWLMTKYIDQFGIRLAQKVYGYFRKPEIVRKEL